MKNSGFAYRSRVEANCDAVSLCTYLARRYSHSDRETWKTRIEAGEVRVNELVGDSDQSLRAGDALEWRRPPWVEPETPSGFAVVHLDEDILVAIKPSGLPTLPGAKYLENTLLHRVRLFDPTASPLHRLGRATSGLVLFSRRRSAHRTLSGEWRTRVQRWYRTLVKGQFPSTNRTCDVPIGPVPHVKLGTVHGATPTGKPARSSFSLLAHTPKGSVVRVRIETGRAHQIRIHAASLGYPLVGDALYKDGACPRVGTDTLPGEGGYWLHAERIRLRHPASDAWLELNCRAPRILEPPQEPTPDSRPPMRTIANHGALLNDEESPC